MAVASNRYLLNGVDLYDTYGYVVSSGSDDLLRPAVMDDPFFHKFIDRNGKHYDLTNPTFTPVATTLRGVLIANSEANFWTQYNALFGSTGVFKTSGTKFLTVVEFGRIYEVFYREVSSITRHNRIKSNSKIQVSLDISLEVLGSFSTTGQIFFYNGAVTAWPTTWSQVTTNLTSIQPEYYGNVFELHTGTIRSAFAFAIPNNRTVKRIVDLSASNVDLTTGFTIQSTVFNSNNNTTYNIYGLQAGMPYTVNHVFRIELN